MKLFLVSFLTLLAVHLFAQNILVPFNSEGKYGLLDPNGKVIVKATFDELKWETGQYFTSANEITIKDTVKTASGELRIRDRNIKRRGVFFKEKEIIKNSNYSKFEIIPGKFIVGQNDNRIYNSSKEEFLKASSKGEFVSLFTISGKNVFPEDFKRIQKFDTAGISSKNDLKSKYVLFGAEHIDNTNSLFVFDTDKQEISGWLVKNAKKITVADARYPNKVIRFDITDENYKLSRKIVDYRSGKFLLSNDPSQFKAPVNTDNTEVREYGTTAGTGNYVTDAPGVPDNIREDVFGNVTKRNDIPYVQNFQMKGDSLFWNASATEKVLITAPKGAALFFAEANGSHQQLPVIFKQDNQFGLLCGNKILKPTYDSLVYFGSGFIAGKMNAGKMQYYFLDKSGEAADKEPYDSIQTKIKQFDSDDDRSQGSKRFLVLKDKPGYSSYNKNGNKYKLEPSERMIVYKNGKAGMINALREIVIPVEYDLIADNGLNFQRPNSGNFIVLKKDGLYGLTEIRYNKELKKYDMSNTIDPVFKQFPAFIAKNYYGTPGLRLVGLYDESFGFVGYASDKGVLYLKK